MGLQTLHIFSSKLEVVYLRVLADPRGRYTLWEGDVALLQAPSQQDLRLGFLVLVGQNFERCFAPSLSSHQRAVRFDGDVSAAAPIDDVVPRAPGVNLVLDDIDAAALSLATTLALELLDVLFQLIKVVDTVVADSDGSDLSLFLGFDKCFPGTLAPLGPAIWTMQEHQIDVLETCLGERLLYLFLGVIVVDETDFGGEEKVGPRNVSALSDRSSGARLVLVRGGRIKLEISQYE